MGVLYKELPLVVYGASNVNMVTLIEDTLVDDKESQSNSVLDSLRELRRLMPSLDTFLRMNKQLSYEKLLQLAKDGNQDAMKLVKWLRKAGTRSAIRNHIEAGKLWNKIPADLQTVLGATSFKQGGMSASHIKPYSSFSKGSGRALSGKADNIVWESITTNQARGNNVMTSSEQLGICVQHNVNLASRAALSGAKVGAAVGGTLSLIQHGYNYYKGKETAFEAIKSVAKDAVVSGVEGAAVSAVSALCPPVGILLFVNSVAEVTGIKKIAYDYIFNEELKAFPEEAIIVIDNNLCASYALPSALVSKASRITELVPA